MKKGMNLIKHVKITYHSLHVFMFSKLVISKIPGKLDCTLLQVVLDKFAFTFISRWEEAGNGIEWRICDDSDIANATEGNVKIIIY